MLRLVIAVLTLALGLTGQSSAPSAQSPSTAQPPTSSKRLIAESEGVRIQMGSVPAGSSTPRHKHDLDFIAIPVTDGSIIEIKEGKTKSEESYAAGEIRIVIKPQDHELHNTGASDFHQLEIELLQRFEPGNVICGMPKPCRIEDFGSAIDTKEMYTIAPLLEMDVVRIIEITMGPGVTMTQRSTKNPTVVVALSPLDLTNSAPEPDPAAVKLEVGGTVEIAADQPIRFRNNSNNSARLYLVEMK